MFLNLTFSLIGGFGLFMYGLKVFSDGLQESTENALKEILHKVTQNKIFGIAFYTFFSSDCQQPGSKVFVSVFPQCNRAEICVFFQTFKNSGCDFKGSEFCIV